MANASYLKNYRQCQHPVHLPDKAAFSEKRAISTVVSASLTHSSEKKKITLAVWLFQLLTHLIMLFLILRQFLLIISEAAFLTQNQEINYASLTASGCK